jgi:hypothetical protein
MKLLSVVLATLIIATTQLSSTLAQTRRFSTGQGERVFILLFEDSIDFRSLRFAADATGTFSTSLPTTRNPFRVNGGTVIVDTTFFSEPAISFTSSASFSGEASFVYRFKDANGNLSSPVPVTITVLKPSLEGMYLLCYHSNMLHGPLIVNKPAHSKAHVTLARFSLFLNCCMVRFHPLCRFVCRERGR